MAKYNEGSKWNFETRKNIIEAWQWWHTPLIPALGVMRQADLCEFEARFQNS